MSESAPQVALHAQQSDKLLERLLRRDEGYRRSAYADHLSYLTLGIGRCIDARKGGGVTEEEALYLLRNDIRDRQDALRASLPWFSTLDPVRQCVLLSMAFQLGVAGLLGFTRTLKAVEEGRYADASNSMLLSKWASQVPLRANRLAQAMRTGDAAAFELDEDPAR